MIAGHTKQWIFLKKMVEMGQLPHALLFSGPASIGKKNVALDLAKALFCVDNQKPCQACGPCREIEKRIHPDVFFVEDAGREISIEAIRKLGADLALKPLKGEWRVAVIDEAHGMRQESQSALLKTLEEPAGKAIIILISSRPGMLLPTIRSRVQEIKFFGVAREETGEGYQKRKQEFLSLFDADLLSRFRYARDLADSTFGSDHFRSWMFYAREMLFRMIKKSAPLEEQWNFIRFLRILQDREMLLSTTRVNRQLTLEVLLMEMPKVNLNPKS